MKALLKTEFQTKEGGSGLIITQKRVDGTFVTTFKPPLGLDFYSIDSDLAKSHETVKNFLRDVKGCVIAGDEARPEKPIADKIRKFLL